jgi:hypothetical protein
MMTGEIEKGLNIVTAARGRYDGTVRNPYNEIECGHWYARALASYAMLQGLTGVRYDAVDKTLYIKPTMKGDVRTFLSTDTGFAVVGVKGGKPFCDVKYGSIDMAWIAYGRTKVQVAPVAAQAPPRTSRRKQPSADKRGPAKAMRKPAKRAPKPARPANAKRVKTKKVPARAPKRRVVAKRPAPRRKAGPAKRRTAKRAKRR